ncbi:MAG: CRISPR-associated helicase Cas3' [Verrucomicrobiae bacterium]|nr:CRISPR-associated helicase Cas3' [Verrucomicrobiae bacterium]
MKFYAHTANDGFGRPLPEHSGKWQPLDVHLRNVAELAQEFAVPLGLGAEAELAGLLHDLGKYAGRFQARLRNPAIHGINHWAAGTAHAAALKAWAVAFAADGHHTGIPALSEADLGTPLRQTVANFADSTRRLELTGQCPEDIATLLARFNHDGLSLPSLAPRPIGKQQRFEEALRTRMLFSCLVDADFLDTEEHFNASQTAQRIVPELQPERALQLLRQCLEAKPADGSVNALRKQLLHDCLSVATKPSGLFTLTAPTGSGKTLASLAFALQHIVHHNARLPENDPRRFRRIIVVIPFTSIIEQTARVYRELFEPGFGPDFVLEHHSAVAPRERKEDQGRDAEAERLRRARLAAENWAAPLVVTTNVQFFQSLFSNRPSDCRKLHNIGRSVVLFDEVQTLPPRLVPSLLSGVSLLVRDYGVSAVFMTATQPAFATAGKALPYDWKPVEISSNPGAMAETLRRTHIQLPQPHEEISWPDLAAKLTAVPQSLCVVNTTKDARELFRLVQQVGPQSAFHLSARLCPAHRQEKLQAVRVRLADGKPCRLVSTQLIEAGVDVDFPIAFRALGPLDSIIQSDGRCNREGHHAAPCPVIVFRPKDGGHLPKGYEQVMKITESFLARFAGAQSRIHQPSFYAEYFAELYGLLGPESRQDDPVFAASEEFNFPKAAQACQLVGNETRAVLVKWRRGAELAEKLEKQKHLTAPECREAQRYCVNLYQSEFFEAQARGYIYQPAEDWNFWVWNSDYDDNLGLGHLDASAFCQ